jgi:hypothetical protein
MKSKHTKDKLADALRGVGLHDMAEQAGDGFYHDFLSPLAMPEMQLIRDLTHAMNERDPDAGQEIAKLRKRVIDGDFDASPEEGDEWAKSAEGRETFSMLVRKL